jgi:tRNA pseudouridine38-40 synthase
MMPKYAMLLEYQGSSYCGWQVQRAAPSIQETLEVALRAFAAEEIVTITAGRTDSGVHALFQVVHFNSSAPRSLSSWVPGVNARLPNDIRARAICIVADDFDARFSALSRTYHYYLQLGRQPSALLFNLLGWYHRELDLSQMQAAASFLLGVHDFSAFRAAGCQARTSVREIRDLSIARQGDLIKFSVTANAFLYHMVRNIVGALIYVGSGRLEVQDFAQLLSAADRRHAPPTFMPNGLYLAYVQYPLELFGPPREHWLYTL